MCGRALIAIALLVAGIWLLSIGFPEFTLERLYEGL